MSQACLVVEPNFLASHLRSGETINFITGALSLAMYNARTAERSATPVAASIDEDDDLIAALSRCGSEAPRILRARAPNADDSGDSPWLPSRTLIYMLSGPADRPYGDCFSEQTTANLYAIQRLHPDVRMIVVIVTASLHTVNPQLSGDGVGGGHVQHERLAFVDAVEGEIFEIVSRRELALRDWQNDLPSLKGIVFLRADPTRLPTVHFPLFADNANVAGLAQLDHMLSRFACESKAT